ncbi:MAG TPA: hypothetical protein VFJ16_04550 [Longimicrobium sp.]|nr:hypothetical protein [Longimicrobium sp.]
MKKLSLDLDQLAVESFDTGTPLRPRGTVRGNDLSDTTCVERLCQCGTTTCANDSIQISCDVTCNGTCDESCDGTCYASCVGICQVSNDAHTCMPPSCYYSCTCP